MPTDRVTVDLSKMFFSEQPGRGDPAFDHVVIAPAGHVGVGVRRRLRTLDELVVARHL